MKNRHLRKTISLLFLSALAGIAARAQASSAPASIGKVASAADASCIRDWYSTVTNTCSHSVVFQIPLLIDSDDNSRGHWLDDGWPVSVQVTGSGDGLEVMAVAMDQLVTKIYAGDRKAFFGSLTQIITTSSTGMPANGYLYLYAVLPPGARINSVNYGFDGVDPPDGDPFTVVGDSPPIDF